MSAEISTADDNVGDGFEEEDFNFDANMDKRARVELNYVKTSNFIAYLKDITSLKQTKEALRQNFPKSDLGDDVEGEGNESGELEAVWKYLDNSYTFDEDGHIDIGKNALPLEFNKEAFETINTNELPHLSSDTQEIVLIEFFTHCCINCIHSIDDVRRVYEAVNSKEPNSLKIISVHSPKFTREKDLQSLIAFTEQMKMDHTVVINDPGCLLWNELGISCWPTLLILGPNPKGQGMNLLFTMMGEGHKHILQLILTSMLSYFKRKLKTRIDYTDSAMKKPIGITSNSISASILKFPGKVVYYKGLLAIADTGNHRIIVAEVNGTVKQIIGGTGKGWLDGDFKSAKFYLPQGIAFKSADILLVADTGNHSIREINLTLEKVSTLIRPDWNCLHDNETVHLRSPWDLTFYSEEILLVAAAGNHRIFAYFFEASKLFMSEYLKGTFNIVAGTGREENRNNSYIMKASFAQPSGICVLKRSGAKTIYIADSESSSIRSIVTEGKGKVSAVVGGARDPTDLFSYGDVDGKGVTAKLQHPMGVCSSDKAAKIYFVDTYNNKVKSIDADSQLCNTVAGNGMPGDEIGGFNDAQFNEPGGIYINDEEEVLYVADTNNHCIKCINLSENKVSKILLTMPKSLSTFDETFYLEAPLGDPDSLTFTVLINNMPSNFEGGQWKLTSNTDNNATISSGDVTRTSSGTGQLIVNSFLDSLKSSCTLFVDIFLCGENSCYKKSLTFLVKLVVHENPKNESNCFMFNPSTNFFL